MTTTPAAPAVPAGFDPTDPDLNLERIPLQEFMELRRTAPVFWVEQPEDARGGMEGGTGYWAISRHEDVSGVSKNNKDFVSSENSAIIRFQPGMTRDQVEMQRVMLINQDPPTHTSTRQIISRGFTPRSIGALRDDLTEHANVIVKQALDRGEGDFVEEVAAELPLVAIADLLGVPQDDRKKLFEWSNQMLAGEDPDYDVDPETASVEILNYFMALAEERKAEPRDDIVTKLVSVGEDGDGLTSDEFGYFTILLAVAGNETTRNAITHGMINFFEHPDQWELYKRERPVSAVDEIIRLATPVSAFQRTAINDTEVGGQAVKKGQRVGLFYASANHDAEVFDNPDAFDIMRDPNPHLAFGGHGAHYCIGANLARLEVEIMFNAIADHLPDITKTAEPRRLRHSWINGIKELRVKYA